MLQTFTFDASQSGGVRQIDAKGTFFRYESGSANGADVGVKVRLDGNDCGIFYPGDSIEQLPIVATRWEIVPNSAVCKGVVRVGMGRVSSARLVGTVDVMDSGKERTKSNLAFADSGFIANAPATNFGTVQLFNPAGSGKRIIVQRVVTNCTQTTNINLSFSVTQAAVLRRQVMPKLSGGAAGVSQVRTENGAASIGGAAQIQRAVQANAPIAIDLREPFVVVPGYGLTVWADPVAGVYGLFADFELIEEVL